MEVIIRGSIEEIRQLLSNISEPRHVTCESMKQHVTCECGHSWYTSKDPAKDRIQCGACGTTQQFQDNQEKMEIQEGKK